jgi:hypothetical protein
MFDKPTGQPRPSRSILPPPEAQEFKVYLCKNRGRLRNRPEAVETPTGKFAVNQMIKNPD